MSDNDARQSPHTEASAGDLLGPMEVLELQEQGRAAAVAGEPVTACPWREAAEPVDRARRDMWVRGYAAGRTELRGAPAGSAAPSPRSGGTAPWPAGAREGLAEDDGPSGGAGSA